MSGYFKAFYTEGENNAIKIDMGLLGMLIVITSAAFVISLQINGVFQHAVKSLVTVFTTKIKNGVATPSGWSWLLSLGISVLVIGVMLGLIWGSVTLYSKQNPERLKSVLPQAQKRAVQEEGSDSR